MDWAENFGVHAGLHGQEDRAGIIIMKIFDRCHCFEAEQETIASRSPWSPVTESCKDRAEKLSKV